MRGLISRGVRHLRRNSYPLTYIRLEYHYFFIVNRFYIKFIIDKLEDVIKKNIDCDLYIILFKTNQYVQPQPQQYASQPQQLMTVQPQQNFTC